jgi:hypothetical protein
VPLPGLHESSQAGSDGATANEGLLHQASPASQSCVFSLHLPAQPSPSGLASHEPPLPLDEMAPLLSQLESYPPGLTIHFEVSVGWNST